MHPRRLSGKVDMAVTTANHFSAGRQGNAIQIIVIHSAENQELPGQAVHLQQWFAGASAPQASAHEMVDNLHVICSVADTDTAWAVDDFPLNLISKSYELTGHAANTAAQWADAYESAVIKEAHTAILADLKAYGIPAVHLTDAQILAAHNGDKTVKGICTHADISRALKIVGGHTDPGQGFPMLQFIKGLTA